MPEIRVYHKHGMRVVEDIVPPGHTVVDRYDPSPTVTPWDYYGIKHQREYAKVLKNAGLEPVLLQIRRTILHPVGSGPGGMVRFGDSMTPGTYMIAVPHLDIDKAAQAIALHQQAVRDWLHSRGSIPEACKE